MESRLEHRQSREQQTCTESFLQRLGWGGSERVGMGGGFMGTHRVLSGGDAHSLFFKFFCYAKRSSTTHGPRVERPPRYKRAPGPSPQAFRVVLLPSRRPLTHHPIFTASRGIPPASVGSTAAAGEWIPGPQQDLADHGCFTRRSAERWQGIGALSLPRAPQLPLEECASAFPQIGWRWKH